MKEGIHLRAKNSKPKRAQEFKFFFCKLKFGKLMSSFDKVEMKRSIMQLSLGLDRLKKMFPVTQKKIFFIFLHQLAFGVFFYFIQIFSELFS